MNRKVNKSKNEQTLAQAVAQSSHLEEPISKMERQFEERAWDDIADINLKDKKTKD